MPPCLLEDSGHLSGDLGAFPLLADGVETVHSGGASWPVVLGRESGAALSLFLGGVATADEVDAIARGIATHLGYRHSGRRVLLVNVLDGGTPFCNRIVARLERSSLDFQLASVKVGSYAAGSRASGHRIEQELRDAQSGRLTDLRGFDSLVVLDDLLDTGETCGWLVGEYLPGLGARAVEACFMLEKQVARRPGLGALLEQNLLNGKRVPDEWVVGYGPDLTLPGQGDLPPLHLFRGELPGGVYAFRRSVEPDLIDEYHRHPYAVREQLGVYITET